MLSDSFSKLWLAYPRVDREPILLSSAKAMNDTLVPEGLVLSSLVFGEIPRTRIPSEIPKPRESISERAALAFTTHAEMQKIMAWVGIARRLRHAVPPSSDVY